jgi:hypothetical protein
MATYNVYNGTDADLSNINGGGDAAPKRSTLLGTTLTNTELGTLLGHAGVLVEKAATTEAQRHDALKCAKLGGWPSGPDTGGTVLGLGGE